MSLTSLHFRSTASVQSAQVQSSFGLRYLRHGSCHMPILTGRPRISGRRSSGMELEMCMGMGFPMGPGIPWESHGNGNKTQNWEWEWEGMGNHVSGNGNYLHSHGNLFPKVLGCDELIKLLVLYLPDADAYYADFAYYRNVIYSVPLAGLCIYRVLGKPRHLLQTYYNYYRITNYIQL